MTSGTSDTLGEGIAYEDTLPISWERLAAAPGSTQLAHWSRANERVLRLVSALEEYHSLESADERFQSAELSRLDFKLNLVLELVGELVALHTDMPPARRVRLNARGLVCTLEQEPAPEVGANVLVSVYLQSSLAHPLKLPAHVVGVEEAADGAAIQLQFYELGEAVVESLEKLLFRHHRRSVAARRAPRE